MGTYTGTHLIHVEHVLLGPDLYTYMGVLIRTGTHLIHVEHVLLGPDLYTYMGVLIRGRILYM